MTSFTLEDQYGKEHQFSFPQDKLSLFVNVDRESARQAEGWVLPIYGRYQDRVHIQGLAQLSEVPSFFRSMARNIVQSNVKHPVLMDWSGTVSRELGYQSGSANVVLVDQNGEVVYRDAGTASPEKLEAFYTAIDAKL